MAKVWYSDTCGICGGPLLDDEESILIAMVKTTHHKARGSYSSSTDKVRPRFGSRSGRVGIHTACVQGCSPQDILEMLGSAA